MGLTLSQAFEKAHELGDGAFALITLATNQDNGIVSVAKGGLKYHPGDNSITSLWPPSFSTEPGAELTYLFYDRTFKVGEVPAGEFDLREDQPFSIYAKDKLGLTLTNNTAKFTLASWGNGKFDVPLETIAGIMYGVGAPIGNNTSQALYAIAITDVSKIDIPK